MQFYRASHMIEDALMARRSRGHCTRSLNHPERNGGGGGRALNLIVLFLSDMGVSPTWSVASADEIAEDAADREMELLHMGRKSPDMILKTQEGIKSWDVRIAAESIWRTTFGSSASFVARSARSVAVAYLKAGETCATRRLGTKGTSAGIVFLETRGIDALLDAEKDRLRKALQEAGGAEFTLKLPLGREDILVVKKGKEGDEPSFARAARVIQESYRPIVERPFHAAGRGLKTSLKEIYAVIEKHAPTMVSDAGLLSEVKRQATV